MDNEELNLLEKGRIEKSNQNYSDAINFFIQAIQLNPKNSEVYFEIASICSIIEEFEEAKKYISIAIEISPQNKDYKSLLQDIDAKRGIVEEPEIDFSIFNYLLKDSNSLDELFTEGYQDQVKNKRLLAVYDFAIQPYSIGDLILFIQTTMLVNKFYGIDKVDFAFIQHDKNCADEAFDNNIKEDNKYFHLFSIIQLIQFTPYVGQFFVFNSDAQFYSHFLNQKEKYVLWPSKDIIENKIYLNYFSFHLIKKYIDEGNKMEWIANPKMLKDWANSFFINNIFPNIPVVVNVRQNKLFGQHRNSIIEEWLKFFEVCNEKYNVKFIIICGVSEIDKRFANLPNVIVAKQFATSIEQDMALIKEAACLIGASSGPTAMTLFSELPYYVVNSDLNKFVHLYKGALTALEDRVRFCFATEFQSYGFKPENCDMLLNEFEKIWQGVDQKSWVEKCKQGKEEITNLTWLR